MRDGPLQERWRVPKPRTPHAPRTTHTLERTTRTMRTSERANGSWSKERIDISFFYCTHTCLHIHTHTHAHTHTRRASPRVSTSASVPRASRGPSVKTVSVSLKSFSFLWGFYFALLFLLGASWLHKGQKQTKTQPNHDKQTNKQSNKPNRGAKLQVQPVHERWRVCGGWRRLHLRVRERFHHL